MGYKKRTELIIISVICAVILLVALSGCSATAKTDMEIHGVNSSELTLNVVEEDGVRREEYVDAEGQITFAADKHYAAVVKQLNKDGRNIAEYYYDEFGEPVILSEGHFGVLREYDESGNEVKMTYVNAQGDAVRITSGYVSILKSYDEAGNEIKDVYVDYNNNPVYRNEGYAGRKREYDEEGHCISITNLDTEGNPTNSTAGYAEERRTFDEENRLKTVMYYDGAGESTTSLLGQYGEAYEYDDRGRRYKIIYLDQNGNITANKDGYAAVVRSFKADNSVEKEMYYDADGQQIKLSHGEYGVKREDGKKYYLTKNGKINYLLSLDELLHGNMLFAVLAGILVCVLAVVLPKSMRLALLILYIVFIIYMTLLYREGGHSEGQFQLFWSYRHFFYNRELRMEICQNIWLFIPLGILLYAVFRKRWVLVVPLAFSIIIELVQYYTGRGLFEFDDMLSDGLGGCIGFGLGKLLMYVKGVIKPTAGTEKN